MTVSHMTYSITGWAGDHAGSVIGRKPNTLLIALNQSREPDYSGGIGPKGLYRKRDLGGVPWYYDCFVECLTPNSLSAFATRITNYNGRWGNVFAIEIRAIDWNRGEDPWAPGVHLFGISLGDYLASGSVVHSATFATAVVSERIEPHVPDPGVMGSALWDLWHESQSGGPRPEGPETVAWPEPFGH